MSGGRGRGLQGAAPASARELHQLNLVRNKIKRGEMVNKLRADKKFKKNKERKKRREAEKKDPSLLALKEVPRTIEMMREADETMVEGPDEEINRDEATDEFARYFVDGEDPKVLITTATKSRKGMLMFIRCLLDIFPGSVFMRRRQTHIKKIVKFAIKQGFTDVMVFTQHKKKPSGLILIHLPDGPTAFFRLTRPVLPKEIRYHGTATEHQPELILNNFNTRLGRRLGRMFAALLPHRPEFEGRRVVTFHNQRDFVFFRQHRYIFEEEGQKVRLQELGPRFTLKLQKLQHGTFDTVGGEYEWMHKRHMDTSKRKFFL